MKSKNKKGNKRKQGNYRSQNRLSNNDRAILYRMVNPSIIKQIVVEDLIYSTSGTSNVTFGISATAIYSLYRFANAADWTAISDNYQRAQFLSFSVEVNRIISDTTASTTYPAGLGPLHIVYYPTVIDTAHTSGVLDVERCMLVNSHGVEPVFCNYLVPSVQCIEASGGQNYLFNPSIPFDINLITHMCGQLEIRINNPGGNATATLPLWSIRIVGVFKFDFAF
jgi:hypothetical protein